MIPFIEHKGSRETYWRALILFGQNVASYKFALGKSLIEIASQGNDFVGLDQLAEPFSRHVVEHLKAAPRQSTSRSSRFLESCKRYGQGEISKDELLGTTSRIGFNNVIDAFHIVNRAGSAAMQRLGLMPMVIQSQGGVTPCRTWRVSKAFWATQFVLRLARPGLAWRCRHCSKRDMRGVLA